MKNKLLKLLIMTSVFVVMFVLLATTVSATEATEPATEEATVLYSGACGTNLTWRIDDAGTMTIDGTGDMNTYSGGNAPWYKYKTQITKIIVNDGITSISNGAFYGLNKVESVVIPSSVTYIGPSILQGCSALKELTIPFVGETRILPTDSSSNVTISGVNYTLGYFFGTESYTGGKATEQYFGEYEYFWPGHEVRYDSTSQSYRTSGRVTSNSLIPDDCLDYYLDNRYYYYTYGDANFRKLYYIPASLTKVTVTDAERIYFGAFSGCENITELNLNDSISQIDDHAFTSLGMITKATTDFVISNHVLLAYKGKSATVDIPEEISIIAPRAFWKNTSVSTVNFANETISVGTGAFYGCTSALINVPKISGRLKIDTGAFNRTGSVKYLDRSSYTNGNDTYYYTVDEGENAVIVGCSTNSSNITLPVTLGGYTVTTVGYRGMASCKTLTSVTIPNNITKLDLYAFASCTNLDTATIPATCVYVGDSAFQDCTSLTTVVIAEGVTHLGDYCFSGCTSLTEIVVPDSCTYLGDYAFYNCDSMVSATIGITVPSIGKYTFYSCEKLATVVIGIKVESIGEYAFCGTALTRLTTPASLKHIGNYAFANCKNLERVALKAGLLTIGDGAFFDDILLATINWPANINSIGASAFRGCSSLASATIPAGVAEIRDYTFAYCTSLNSVTVEGTLTSIGEKAFYRDALTAFTFTEGLTSIGADAFAFNALTEISLPNSVVYIGEQAFNECVSLTSVSIPDSVTYVGAYAFSANANNLTITIRYNTGKIADHMLYNTDMYEVIMENGITEIGNYVFALCHELAEITFPNTLREIGDYAFYDNRSYSELTLPGTMTSIGSYAFARGYDFVKINIPDSVQSIGDHAFYRGEANNHVNPELTVYFYYNNGILCDNILDGQDVQHIIVADNIHTVGNNAFSNSPYLIDISLPDTIASFGADCFLNDNSITMSVRSVDGYIDDEIYKEKLKGVSIVNVDNTEIGNSSFYGNIWIKKATITGISNIGNYAFYNCNSITDVIINGTVEHIGEHAFDSCKALKEMVLPITVNYIGSYAFYDCNSMSSINIPDGIEKILSHTFYGCASLGSIEVPNSVIAVEDYAFYGCVVATNITLSDQCKTIGEAAFYNCKALTELNIPDSVTSIGTYAFRSCGGITELVFSDNVDKIGACAFYDCNGLKTVKLGKKIIELGDRLFYGCVNLESLYVYAPLSYIDTLAFYGADFVTVYCGRDDYMISFFDENDITYVILDDLIYEYKITFATDNGEIISSATYTSGSTVTLPTNPSKSADNTYTYVFAGWDQEITIVGGNKTYTAIFTPVYIEYTVVFEDYNGTELSSKIYHYGDVVTAPSNPTRVADNTYTYDFAGWNNEVVACAGDTTYTATYTPAYIKYTVEFKDFDGELLSSNTYHYGDTIVVPANPTKAPDLLGTYSFKGWDNEIVACKENATYTATYDITYIDYTVVFKNYDGSVISTNTYHYGDSITVPSAPTKAADATYTYVFAGWNNDITVCDGNKAYIATFTSQYIDYTVIFKNYDDTAISTKIYHYGEEITVPSNPIKPSDERYSYTFAGWDNPVASCSGDATYKAIYSSKYIDYTITFVDYNGTVLETKTYHYGETIEAIDNPTKAADNTYTYAFAGWDKDLSTCEGNETFTATYISTYIKYKVVFKNHDGSTITEANYHYGDKIVLPTIPQKPSDENYFYVFAGWDKSVANCYGNAVYTAKFTACDLPIVTVDNSSARANETVIVDIILSGAPNLESLAISDIIYNANAFELVGVEWKVSDAILSNWDATTGKGALALSTAKNLNGTIISLTFKVNGDTADGKYPVSCTVISHECDFKNVAGQINVYSVVPGDVDGNESVDKNDAIYLLMHSFYPEDYPINQKSDYNGNGMVDKDDAIYLLMYTFYPDDYPLTPAPKTATFTIKERKKIRETWRTYNEK